MMMTMTAMTIKIHQGNAPPAADAYWPGKVTCKRGSAQLPAASHDLKANSVKSAGSFSVCRTVKTGALAGRLRASDRRRRRTMGQNQVILRHSIIYIPMSEGVSEMSAAEGASEASSLEQANE